MDRLLALQTFARVVQLGGFTKAGDSLQLSKTTVSDLVQSLEARLGVRLFQRTTRRVTVTPDGAAFYERCSRILADLEEAEAVVMQARVEPKRRLRVDVPSAFGRLFVIPALPRSSHPLPPSAPGARDRPSTGASARGGRRLRRAYRRAAGLELGRAANRYAGLHLLCESRVLCGSTASRARPRTCQPTGASPSCRIARDVCSTGSSFEMGGSVELALDGILAVNDHDANVVSRCHESWDRKGRGLRGAAIPGIGAPHAGARRLDGGSRKPSPGDVSAKPSPLGEGARLRRMGKRAAPERSASPGHAYCSQSGS